MSNQQLQREITEGQWTETTLTEEGNLLRTLIDNLPDLIYVKDTESRVVLANAASLQLRQTTNPDELIGKTDFEMHPPELAAQYYADDQAVMRSGQFLIGREERHITPSGEEKWFSTTKVPFRDSQGQIIGLVGMSRDITERRHTEEELQRYRDHLEDLVIERTAGLRAANQQLRQEITERKHAEAERERLLAAEREQRLLAETMQEVTLVLTSHMDHAAVLDEILRQAQRIVPCKTAHITLLEDGVLRMARWYGYPSYDLEEMMAKLGQHVADFPLDQWIIQSRLPLTIPDTAQDSRWVTVPEAAWIKSHIAVPICLQDQVLGLLRLDSDIPGKFSFEDAKRLQTLANVAAIALGNARLHAETQARLHEQTLLRQAGAIISSTLDLTAVLSYIAEQMVQIIDVTSVYISSYSPETVTVTVLAEYISPQASSLEKVSDLDITYYLPDHFPGILYYLQSGQSKIYHLDDPDLSPGERAHFQKFGAQTTLSIPLQIGGQTIAYASLWESRRRREFTSDEVALCQAIAQQAAIAIQNAQLHQQTEKQARQLEQILHSVRAGIILLDADYRVKVVNAAGQDHLALLAGVDMGQILTHLGGCPIEDIVVALPRGQSHQVTPVGSSYPLFQIYARPVVADLAEVEGWVMVVRDVTEERAIQQRLQQQEKLAAVGQLAAGIAHDFNNILTSIIGFAELARYTPNVPESVADDLSHIVQQGRRGAHLVRQILDFARKNIAAKRLVDVGHLLEEVVKLLKRTIPKEIQLDLTIEPDQLGFMLNADTAHLQQAFTNLAVNAADAMPAGGALKFILSRFTLTASQRPPCPEMRPGDWLALEVADTGVGMSLEVQKHLFEPFFTTKEVGQGTGLGLAQVEGIVKQHEGCIQVESWVGQGTTFTLYFPALPTSQPLESLIMIPDDEAQVEHDKLILLVEDNQSVLEVVQAMLKGLGYQVVTAINGREALQIYERHRESVALVITDLTMPEMGGLALTEALRAKNSAVKIVAMTGYPPKMKREEMLDQGIVAWLHKPLSLEHLAQELRQVF